MINTRIVSSLEKCFLDEDIQAFADLNRISMLKNERLSFQLLHTADGGEIAFRTLCQLTVEGDLAPYITARTVDQVPVVMPEFEGYADANYLRHTPGLYPDVLRPLHYRGKISVVKGRLQSVWLELDPGEGIDAGTHTLTLTLIDPNGETVAKNTLTVHVINDMLPPQEMIFTQWMHCDCLANYYDCDAWSEEHWRIVENYAATAVKNGINLLLTPIHTPPLDTERGGERRTCQLVDVTVTNGEYSFGFEKLDRWIDMCDRVGVQYFEIAHFFTQWGAEHAPKIMATVDGEYRRIFGWETDAAGEAYSRYLRTFIPAFLAHMRARGDDKRCFFHISDEPNEVQLGTYRAARAVVADLLKGYTIMDALSDFSYWKQGLVETPIPATDHIEPFIEANVPGLWSYYCCMQRQKVSNRFLSMPLWRTRCIGMQFYKFDIVGFLHWGYNHYNNQYSVNAIDPFSDISGEYWVPAGDTHSVYPASDGTALESVRILSFYEGLQDARAMKLAERYHGKAAVVAAMEEILGDAVRFDVCPTDAATMLRIREKINEMIEHQ